VLVIRSDVQPASLPQRLRNIVKKLGGKENFMPRIPAV
jgi:hypothetical protein